MFSTNHDTLPMKLQPQASASGPGNGWMAPTSTTLWPTLAGWTSVFPDSEVASSWISPCHRNFGKFFCQKICACQKTFHCHYLLIDYVIDLLSSKFSLPSFLHFRSFARFLLVPLFHLLSNIVK